MPVYMTLSVAGCWLLVLQAKIEMYSRYERQKDKRNYGDRHQVFHGPTWLYPAKRTRPHKIVKWDEEGLPIYEAMGEGDLPPEDLEEEEA